MAAGNDTPVAAPVELSATLLALIREANALSGGVLAAVDQEIGGICRLHDLVPPFPPTEQIPELSSEEFETISSRIALAAKGLGINCFLGPVLDVVTGANPWLQGRTWSTDPADIARISSAYIRGIQANGIAATAKHFPGYSNIALDPAVTPDARVEAPLKSFETSFLPFFDAVEDGVEIVMTGPAVVEAFDPERAASISPAVIRLLRDRFGFEGVVMSDDLDSRATLRGRSILQVAVDALNAGSDLLLIADVEGQIDRIALAIIHAVNSGELAEPILADAAAKIRTLTEKYRL